MKRSLGSTMAAVYFGGVRVNHEFAIRGMLPADMPALRRLFLESRRAAFTWLDPATLSLEDFDASIAGETVLVATHDGRPVGFVAWWPPENFVHGAEFAVLHMQLQGTGKP